MDSKTNRTVLLGKLRDAKVYRITRHMVKTVDLLPKFGSKGNRNNPRLQRENDWVLFHICHLGKIQSSPETQLHLEKVGKDYSLSSPKMRSHIDLL